MADGAGNEGIAGRLPRLVGAKKEHVLSTCSFLNAMKNLILKRAWFTRHLLLPKWLLQLFRLPHLRLPHLRRHHHRKQASRL